MQFGARRDDLITVAKLYYLGNKTQQEISHILKISRPKVARLLAHCRERKIVRFHIDSSESHLEQLGERILRHFKLQKVVVTPSAFDFRADMAVLAKALGQYLDEILSRDTVIGLTFSTVLEEFVKLYTPRERPKNIKVVQMIGGTRIDHGSTNARQIIVEFAKKLDASPFILQAPLVVNNTLLKTLLLQEPEITAHFSLLQQLDVALMSFGSDLPKESIMYKAGYISLEESNELISAGMIADICARRFFSDGSMADTPLNERVIGIDIADLRRVPVIIGLGYGGERAESIIAAANAGLISVLFLDESAAITIISRLNIRE